MRSRMWPTVITTLRRVIQFTMLLKFRQAPAMMQTQQPHHHAVAPEFPLYIPKPGRPPTGADSDRRPPLLTAPTRMAELWDRLLLLLASRVEGLAQQLRLDVNRLNESLKSELQELDGAIQQHQRVNALQSDIRRGQGQKVLKTF
uniref:t-SNARE coiled-coil homology domain-containing protein n=1 Tax=Macrostomum lignano TaxID=282301 RepID=A0A1I8HPK2_9PLAT